MEQQDEEEDSEPPIKVKVTEGAAIKEDYIREKEESAAGFAGRLSRRDLNEDIKVLFLCDTLH